MIDTLSRSTLFRGMADEKISKILGSVVFQRKRYPAEAMLAFRNDACQHLSILLSGSVRGEMYSFNGKTIKVEDIHAPEPFASAFLFGEKQYYPVNVVSNEPCEVLYIPRDGFLRILQQHPQVLNNYMDRVASRAQLLADKLWFIHLRSLREKIAAFALDRCSASLECRHNFSQNQMADLFGVTRPSLSRALNALVKEGLIENQRNKIIIKDKNALLRIVQD